MDEANAHARKFRAQLGGGRFGGLGIEFVGFLDQRADPIGLTLLPTRFGDARQYFIALFVRQHHGLDRRSEEHTSELQSLMRISYAVFCLTKKNTIILTTN